MHLNRRIKQKHPSALIVAHQYIERESLIFAVAAGLLERYLQRLPKHFPNTQKQRFSSLELFLCFGKANASTMLPRAVQAKKQKLEAVDDAVLGICDGLSTYHCGTLTTVRCSRGLTARVLQLQTVC